jgi:Tfp pilus assembly protein PilF
MTSITGALIIFFRSIRDLRTYFRIALFLFPIVILSPGCKKTVDDDAINLQPMYGGVQKTGGYLEADSTFIVNVTKEAGSREAAAQQCCERAWMFLKQDSLDLSMKRFNQTWLLDPSMPEIYFGFAGLEELKGDSAQASLFFAMAYSRVKDSANAVKCLIRIALHEEGLGDTARIVNAWMRITRFKPNEGGAYGKAAYFKGSTNDTVGVLALFAKAITNDPTDYDSFDNYGWFLLAKCRRPEDAITEFTRAIAIDPQNIRGYANRIYAENIAGRFDDAKKDELFAIKLMPTDGTLRRILGATELKMGDTTSACQDLRLAMKLGDPDAGRISKYYCK